MLFTLAHEMSLRDARADARSLERQSNLLDGDDGNYDVAGGFAMLTADKRDRGRGMIAPTRY
jgi:hypothetical protein